MIADTSVWIDFSRDRATWQAGRLAAVIRSRSAVMVDPAIRHNVSVPQRDRVEAIAGNAPLHVDSP